MIGINIYTVNLYMTERVHTRYADLYMRIYPLAPLGSGYGILSYPYSDASAVEFP